MPIIPGEWKDAAQLAGMTPWACSYEGPNGRTAITLYGTDADQVFDDNCIVLPDLHVDGELVATAPAIRIEDDE